MLSEQGKNKTAHIVSHTHWDREWRWPIWQTRLFLVKFIDQLLDLLESGVYAGFLLDGQVMPVIDYLEIRPENKGRIISLVKSGKLQIGPWYILPDEYPVDGEALVRALSWGIRKSQEFGGAFMAGYTPFGWGQTKQLPQIYNGFGIDTGFIGKKVSKKRATGSEFIWRSPDGSSLLSTRFGEDGRANFYFKYHLPVLWGKDYGNGDKWQLKQGEKPVFHRIEDKAQSEQDIMLLSEPCDINSDILSQDKIDALWNSTDESVIADDRLMMNGCDYTAAQPLLKEMIEYLNEKDNDPDRHWAQATILEFLEIWKQKLDRSKLKVVEGELRDGPSGPLTGNALSTRLYIKKLNKYAQNMLIRFAEPFSAISWTLGSQYPQKFLELAWEHLLQSHPHDSINGVTQDKTVEDVQYRLAQTIDISQTIGNEALQNFVRAIDTSGYDKQDILIVVFNPLPYARQEVVQAWVDMPDDTPKNPGWFAYCPPEGIKIVDSDGNNVSTQWQGSTLNNCCVSGLHTRSFPYNSVRHKVFFDTGEVPGCGYKIFKAVKLDEKTQGKAHLLTSNSTTGNILKSPDLMENEFLKVKINSNGTFDITDKRTGKCFLNMNYYEDSGQVGDYWVNRKPMYDRTYNSLGCNAEIWAEESGPLRAVLVSRITMRLPVSADKNPTGRTAELKDMTIKTSVSLSAGSDAVDVAVEFENNHEDHRLRVMFPTGIENVKKADAGGHFIVDSRDIKPQGPEDGTIWQDMATQPHSDFVDVSDGKNGVAFINDCLTEYEVLQDDSRTVALTLLRAVGNWICTEFRVGSVFPSQKGSQCFGKHSYKYAIKPHLGDWRKADIAYAAQNFNAPLKLVQTSPHSNKKASLSPSVCSFVVIDNKMLRFSALKKACDRDTLILRIYNLSSDTEKGILSFYKSVEQAWLTDLNETRIQELKVSNGKVSLKAEPFKILTIEVHF